MEVCAVVSDIEHANEWMNRVDFDIIHSSARIQTSESILYDPRGSRLPEDILSVTFLTCIQEAPSLSLCWDTVLPEVCHGSPQSLYCIVLYFVLKIVAE
jgi:hypothetical protein